MNKEEQIHLIHKILYIREDVENLSKPNMTLDSYLTCLDNSLIRFSGINMTDKQLQSKIIETLKGLKILYTQLSVKQVRSSILGLMNDIDRSVKIEIL